MSVELHVWKTAISLDEPGWYYAVARPGETPFLLSLHLGDPSREVLDRRRYEWEDETEPAELELVDGEPVLTRADGTVAEYAERSWWGE